MQNSQRDYRRHHKMDTEWSRKSDTSFNQYQYNAIQMAKH